MPCRSYDDDVRVVVDTKALDAATRAACEALTMLANFKGGYVRKLSAPTQKWWEKHQEQDRRRIAAENAERNRARLKAAAVAKLTEEERKVLGI